MPINATAPSARSAQNHRFHLLDALRGLLAMLVVYRHSPAYLTAHVPTKNNFLAVDFFFCLSGFVIAYAYEERLRTKLSTGDFMVARLIRFYPTFLVGTLLAFFFALGPEHLFSQPGGHATFLAALPSLFFLPSLPLAPGFLLFSLNMSSWTLLNELVANLGYGLLVRGKRLITPTLILVAIASFYEMVRTPLSLDSGSTWPGVLVGVARMGLSFPIGVFVLRAWRRMPMGGLRRTGGLPTALTIVVLLLTAILVQGPFRDARSYQLLVISLLIPSLIFFGADIQLGKAGSALCGVLGELSYPLYIVHLPLLSPLFGAHVAHFAEHSELLLRFLVPVYIGFLAALSWALRVYIDAPLGSWLTKRYKSYRESRSARRISGRTVEAKQAGAQQLPSTSRGQVREQPSYAAFPQRS